MNYKSQEPHGFITAFAYCLDSTALKCIITEAKCRTLDFSLDLFSYTKLRWSVVDFNQRLIELAHVNNWACSTYTQRKTYILIGSIYLYV